MEQLSILINNEIKKLQGEKFIYSQLIKDYNSKIKTFKKIIKLSEEVKTDISVFEQEIISLDKSIQETEIKFIKNNVSIKKLEKVKNLLGLE